ncbi:hypothetical protein PROFUN_07867, partial [Planoprotostelium fungivorum]
DEEPYLPTEKKRKMNGSGSVKNPVYISVSDDDGEPSQEVLLESLPFDTNKPITRSRTKAHKSRRAQVICRLKAPEGSKTGAIIITDKEVDMLEPGEFLGDSIIEFYLRHIFEGHLKNSPDEKRFYFFNTFFYRKIASSSSTEKWTKGVDIFDYKYVLIPINESEHWSLLIVCMDEDNPEFRGKLLILDSLGSGPSKNTIFTKVRKWLAEEWLNKRGTPKPFTRETMKGKFPNVPKQDNGCDCGVFLLQYAEAFCTNPPQTVEELNEEWFPQDEIVQKRDHIRTLIRRLQLMQDSSKEEEKEEEKENNGDDQKEREAKTEISDGEASGLDDPPEETKNETTAASSSSDAKEMTPNITLDVLAEASSLPPHTDSSDAITVTLEDPPRETETPPPSSHVGTSDITSPAIITVSTSSSDARTSSEDNAAIESKDSTKERDTEDETRGKMSETMALDIMQDSGSEDITFVCDSVPIEESLASQELYQEFYL